jgi:CheY-like chemotaxis protein
MDIMMPEMDGFAAMRAIRERPEWQALPIIALTAKAMKDDQQQCIAAGASDYMAKPIDVEKLLSLLRVWLRKR